VQESNINSKIHQISFNANDASLISRENEQVSLDDKDEAQKIKVRKAKNYRIRPEHERFIENILEANRAKAVTECPPTSHKSSSAALKKSPFSKAEEGSGK
jgi:hypothetical protein